MMQKKLTLSIDGELIEFAHEYAKKNKRSVSAIVEEYFIQLRKTNSGLIMDPRAERLYGIFAEEPVPDKKTLRKNFYDKSDR